MKLQDLALRIEERNLQDEIQHKISKYVNYSGKQESFVVDCFLENSLLLITLSFSSILEKEKTFDSLQDQLKSFFQRLNISLERAEEKENSFSFFFRSLD